MSVFDLDHYWCITDIQDAKECITVLKDEIQNMQINMDNQKSEIEGLKEEVAQMKLSHLGIPWGTGSF